MPLAGLVWAAVSGTVARGCLWTALFLLAPLPAAILARRRAREHARRAAQAEDEAARAAQLYETLRLRTRRLREELSAADQQARLAHQLALLGQFVAGFLHEVNNPLGILIGRVEVLLDERRKDAPLCSDLSQILAEARYIEKIASTLLPALQKAKSEGPFEPAVLADAIQKVAGSLRAVAEQQGAEIVFERADAPRVNLPSHVVEEVLRALVSNALQALKGTAEAKVWVRLRGGQPARSVVTFEVEDNGPGIPPAVVSHLFEPFVSRGGGMQRSGLGLFIVASLLFVYDGAIRHEPGASGGARFVVEVPPARFTREQPYHWFVGAAPGDGGNP